MPNIEKVLLALEHHKRTAVCNGCPYMEDNDTPEGYCPVYDDAIALLREQEPAEPHWRCPTVYMNGTGKIELICGNCGISIPLGKPSYCPWCGKKVKWNDACKDD